MKLFNREIKGEEELLEPEWKIFISPSFLRNLVDGPLATLGHKPKHAPFVIIAPRSMLHTQHTCPTSHADDYTSSRCPFYTVPPTPLPADGISAGERDLCVEHTHTHTRFSWIYSTAFPPYKKSHQRHTQASKI